MRITSIGVALVVLFVSLAQAVPSQQFQLGKSSLQLHRWDVERIIAYRQASEQRHQQYLAKIEGLKESLRNRIPAYPFGSFYGACPEDTLWAMVTVQNPQLMADIRAENHTPNQAVAESSPEDFILESGQLVFAEGSSLDGYKADPRQPSIVLLAATNAGPRIAASTVLTAEGMQRQSVNGCSGCHVR